LVRVDDKSREVFEDKNVFEEIEFLEVQLDHSFEQFHRLNEDDLATWQILILFAFDESLKQMDDPSVEQFEVLQ
jgi:hypothetical protein